MLSLIPFALFGLAVAHPSGLAARATCDSGVHLIVARGTFEPQGFSLQQPVVNAVLAAIPGSSATQVVYPASTDIYNSVQAGVNNTLQQLTDYYNACPNGKIALMGYSQGASVIGNALAGGSQPIPPSAAPGPPATAISQTIGKNVVAVVFFGDYNRVLGQGTDNEPSSCTVSASGARSGVNYANMQFYADRLDEYCNAMDPVCCSSGANILAHLSYFDTANSNAVASYVSAKFSASH